MESLDYWRLCDHLSVSQAALLVAGHDPGATGDDFTDWEPRNYPNGYSAALNAVQNAVMAGSISATIRYKEGLGWLSLPSSGEPIVYDDGTIKDIQELPIDWRATRLEVDSLKRWLRSRGFAKGFFFPAGPPEADYLDPDDPSYSPKLAAAVKAWEESGTILHSLEAAALSRRS